jgi:hypothetical protein
MQIVVERDIDMYNLWSRQVKKNRQMNELRRELSQIKFRAVACASEHFRAASAQEADGGSLFFTCRFSLHDLLCKLWLACERQKKWESAWNGRLSASREKEGKKRIACSWIVRYLPVLLCTINGTNLYKLRLLRATVHSGSRFLRAHVSVVTPSWVRGSIQSRPISFWERQQTHIESLSSA